MNSFANPNERSTPPLSTQGSGWSPPDRSARVCVLTSAHAPFDMRIFQKEAITLAQSGYEVHLVAPSDQDGMVHGVQFHGVTRENGRRGRMTRTARDVYRLARSLRADVYHFHDPELIPFGV